MLNWRTHAANTWWGFATATDRQRLEAVIRRGVRSGLRRLNILTSAELTEDMDDELLQRISWDKNHILHALLPDRRADPDWVMKRTQTVSVFCYGLFQNVWRCLHAGRTACMQPQ